MLQLASSGPDQVERTTASVVKLVRCVSVFTWSYIPVPEEDVHTGRRWMSRAAGDEAHVPVMGVAEWDVHETLLCSNCAQFET